MDIKKNSEIVKKGKTIAAKKQSVPEESAMSADELKESAVTPEKESGSKRESAKKITHEWRYLFSDEDLEKGLQYIKKGEYGGLIIRLQSAEGMIGSKYDGFYPKIAYSPQAYSQPWDKEWFSCTCAKSRGGYRKKNRYYSWYGSSYDVGETCPHMAALMLLWEKKHGPWSFAETEEEKTRRLEKERQLREEEARKKLIEKEKKRREVLKKTDGTVILPVGDYYDVFCPDTSDCYFDLKHISKKLKTTKYAYDRAKSLLEKGKSTFKAPTLNKSLGEQQLKASADIYDEVDASERWTPDIAITASRLEEHRCQCRYERFSYFTPQNNDSKPMCEHELVLLKLTAEYIAENNPGDATDVAAERFLTAMNEFGLTVADEPAEEKKEKTKNIVIDPLITIEDGRPKLSFRIGLKGTRMYQLKSLHEFAEAYEMEKVFRLGKNVEIDFDRQDFTDESESWLSFVMQRISDNDMVNSRIQSRRYWGYSSVSLQNKEILEGATLDRFYDIAEGTDCAYANKKSGTDGTLRVGHKAVRMEITSRCMKNSSGKILGIDIDGRMPVLLKGSRDSYMLDSTALSRISKEEDASLRPFEKASDSTGKVHFRIGKSNLAEFYYRIVPILIEQPFIDYTDLSSDEVESLLPPEGVFTFKLDIANGLMTCALEVSYGERDIRLPEEINSNDYRDSAQETRVMEAVGHFFINYDSKGRVFVVRADKEAVFRLLNDGIPTFIRYGKVLATDAFQKLKIRPMPQVKVGVGLDGGLLDLEIVTKDMDQKELLSLLESYRSKKRYHQIKNGDFIALDSNDQLDALINIADDLDLELKDLVSGHMELPSYRALYLDKLLEEHDALNSSRDKTYRALIKNFQTIRDADYEIPGTMNDTLRSYQAYGFKWLRTLQAAGFGGILADEMGLGKTVQAIALFESWREQGIEAPILVVCPASLVYNWYEEIKRFAPKLKVETLTGTAAERKTQSGSLTKFDPKKSPQVCVISYDLLRRDIALYDKTEFMAVVIDEAQYIKNQKAAMTKAVKGLKARYRYALTGTPIENRLAELWSIFDFLMPGFLYDYQRFSTQFESPIVKSKDEAASKRLKAMVRPFILRRLKNEVLKDLPEKLEEVRYAKLEDSQRKVYDAQVVKMKQMIGSGLTTTSKKSRGTAAAANSSPQDKMQIFAELVRLRELCCDPSLIFENYDGASAKKEACLDLIESAIEGGHRMLVFSQFVSMLEILERELINRKIGYYKITGSTPKEQRLRLVHDFNEGDIPVFLISLKAGGTGLNLTGADVVIHYDPWWNLAVQNQATDRAHRIGQKNKVTVYRMIAKDTIEEKILALQEAKKDLAEEILSGEGKSIYTLSNDELLALLE
ncbi:MAG: DEAD/DEAH box helicase [Lachnospiraceae bacterium]|nr:DEAD/DEAH box helicase [Lachnospiraceae bacterium]